MLSRLTTQSVRVLNKLSVAIVRKRRHLSPSNVSLNLLMPLQVEQNDETIIEHTLVRKFDNNTCNCSMGPKKTVCSAQFTVEVTEQMEHCHILERSELDLVVLSQLMALGKDVPSKSTEDPMRSKYVEFYFKGKCICRVTFLFLYTLSLKRYCNLLQHVCSNGIVPRVHGNYHKAPHNRIPFNDIQAIVTYLRNLANHSRNTTSRESSWTY